MKLRRTAFLALAFSALALNQASAALRINEIRIDNLSSDTDEYAEIKGDPGESLDDVWYLQIGDHSGDGAYKGSGVVEFAVDLTGEVIPEGGYYLIGNATMTLIDISEVNWFIGENSFENSDNITQLLVRGYTGPEVTSQADQLGALAIDIDSGDAVGDVDDDGVPNQVLPWTEVIDAVGFVEETDAGEWYYGAALGFVDVGPDGTFVPGQIFRYEDTGEWVIGDFSFDGGTDTPKAPNPNAPTVPVISSISENYIIIGETLVITGENFSNVTGVTIGDLPASFTIVDDTTIHAVIPDGEYGPVVVTNPSGSGSSVENVIFLDPDTVLALEENFTDADTLGAFTAFSLASGKDWEWRSYDGDGYAYINGYANGEEPASDDWLVSSAIDLTNVMDPGLHIQTMANFSGPDLEVSISTDYDGVSSPDQGFTWTPVSGLVLSDGDYALTDSGIVDIPEYAGEVIYLAIRYTSNGSGSGDGKTYEVTQVLVGGSASMSNANPWTDLPHVEGWVTVEISGPDNVMWLNDAAWPYVYSLRHGWLYMDVTQWPDIYMYNFSDDVGWLYTAEGLYPFMKSLETDEWGWFDQGSTFGKRRFYIYTGDLGWITVPDEG